MHMRYPTSSPAVAILAIVLTGGSAAAATIDVASHGAVPNDDIDDRIAIQKAMEASQPGDTVQFAPGVYELQSATLPVKTGRTLRGAPGLATTLKFANDAKQFGLRLEPNSSRVAISGLKIIGAGIQMSFGDGFRDITIADNEITGVVNEQAIQAWAPTDGLVVEHNHIHDCNVWGYDIRTAANLSINYNVFDKITQVGHLERPGNNIKLNYNLATGLVRMGHEVQTQADDLTSVGGEVIGNVIYGWRDYMAESFGLSIVARQRNWMIRDNYVRGDFTGKCVQTAPGGKERMGIGIEVGGYRPGLIGTPAIKNIVGGEKWQHHIVASLPNHSFLGNKMFGRPLGDWFGANPGDPPSSWRETDTVKDKNFANMPPPPTIDGVGPRITQEAAPATAP